MTSHEKRFHAEKRFRKPHGLIVCTSLLRTSYTQKHLGILNTPICEAMTTCVIIYSSPKKEQSASYWLKQWRKSDWLA